jgi:amino-acid N-acetyltransferase
MADIHIRPAHVGDVVAMQRLIAQYAERDDMLPRALHELYESIRDFVVAEDAGEVVGCAALHVNWANLAEVKSLAVSEARQGCGLGRLLVAALITEARELGVASLFCLTTSPGFFRKLGFVEVDRDALPRKVWSECVRCPRFNNCNEVAMTLRVLMDATPAPPDPLVSLATLPKRHGR